MTKELSNTFDIDMADEVQEDLLNTMQLPENPTLDDIARVSLEVFGSMLKETTDIPAPYRARNLEVAKQFLECSKDAIHKKNDLNIKQQKIEIDSKKANKKGALSGEGSGESGVVSRRALMHNGKK